MLGKGDKALIKESLVWTDLIGKVMVRRPYQDCQVTSELKRYFEENLLIIICARRPV